MLKYLIVFNYHGVHDMYYLHRWLQHCRSVQFQDVRSVQTYNLPLKQSPPWNPGHSAPKVCLNRAASFIEMWQVNLKSTGTSYELNKRQCYFRMRRAIQQHKIFHGMTWAILRNIFFRSSVCLKKYSFSTFWLACYQFYLSFQRLQEVWELRIHIWCHIQETWDLILVDDAKSERFQMLKRMKGREVVERKTISTS